MSKRFNVDDTVKIVDDGGISKCQNLVGKIGIIERECYTTPRGLMYGVSFEDIRNESSSYGVFWFKPNSLKKDKFIKKDNEVEVMKFFGNNYRIAMVDFNFDMDEHIMLAPETHSFAVFDRHIEVGDFVVVKTTNHRFCVAKVVDFINEPTKSDIEYVEKGREIVCKADFSDYINRRNNRIRKSELKNQMDEKIKKIQENQIYEMFANSDEGLKSMLEEFKRL